jgi:hypothetical protein
MPVPFFGGSSIMHAVSACKVCNLRCNAGMTNRHAGTSLAEPVRPDIRRDDATIAMLFVANGSLIAKWSA